MGIRGNDSRPRDASRRHLLDALDASLARLGTDHVDLWQMHAWDERTPLEETLAALDAAVASGRTRYVGISNYTGWQTAKAAAWQRAWPGRAPDRLDPDGVLPAPARASSGRSCPPRLNLGVGILPWSPLGRGVLTGKYRDGTPADSRGSSAEYSRFVGAYLDERASRIVGAVSTAADGLGVTPLAVSLAWVRDRPGVVSPHRRGAHRRPAQGVARRRLPGAPGRDPQRPRRRLGDAAELSRGRHTPLTAAQARTLLATPELLAEAAADDLAVAERLRRTWPVDLVAAASEQAALRGRAAGKLADADSLLLTRAGLEQATSQPVARHRAARFAGLAGYVVDLCCGIGGDLRALADVSEAIGVDRDEVHAICARHNSGRPVVVADVADVRLGAAVAAVFIDPARREGDRRGGSRPPLAWCTSLPVDRIAVKAAPGVDRAAVPGGWETEFVADGRDLKEATLWSPAWATAESRATVLPGGESLVHDPGCARAAVRSPGRFLLDPSPAVTRAGAVADLAGRLDAWQIDPKIGFLSADHPLATPFGRSMTVEASLPFGVKRLAAELRRLDVGAIDIRRRGLAGDVDDLRRRLRPRGRRRATVVLTRVSEQPWALICLTGPEAPADRP